VDMDLKGLNQRLANVLIGSIGIALLAYVTLDAIYFHVFFSADNAVVVPLIQSLIVIVGTCLAVFVRRTEKPMQPSSITQKQMGRES
jgi:hypothetical protein